MKSKIAALLFFLFLVLIIVAADTGRMPSFLRSMYGFPNGDRVGHVVLYGILAFLLACAFPRAVRFRRLSIPIAIIALLIFSGLEECSQALFSTRNADVVDFACSCAGIFIGSWTAYRWRNSRKATGKG